MKGDCDLLETAEINVIKKFRMSYQFKKVKTVILIQILNNLIWIFLYTLHVKCMRKTI